MTGKEKPPLKGARRTDRALLPTLRDAVKAVDAAIDALARTQPRKLAKNRKALKAPTRRP